MNIFMINYIDTFKLNNKNLSILIYIINILMN